MGQVDEDGKLNRRQFIGLGAMGVTGYALAGIPHETQAQDVKPAVPETLMLFPGNYTWSAAAKIAINSSLYGGAEIGEIYKVCAVLQGKNGNAEAWFSEWSKMAEKVALLAEQARSKGYLTTASGSYLRAACYIQMGERLLQPRTAESQKAYARSVDLFKKGMRDLPLISAEPVEIPFEGGKSLPAYFVKRKGVTGVKWPTVVFFDGLDVTKEILYLSGAPELVNRGMACLLVDGPGNGEAIRFRGMPGRHDSNVAGTAAVDYLEKREDVDRLRLAVMGISLGGYHAPRCAAFEKRYQACVAWGAQYDYHAVWKRRVERAFKASLSVPGDHINWFLGVDRIEDALKKLEPWTLKGILEKVQCPFLLTHGEADAQISMEDAERLISEVGSRDKTLKVFTRAEGGAEHCQLDNFTIGITYIADWLSDRLKTQGGKG